MPSATDSPRSSSPGCHQDGSAYPQGDRYSAGTDALTMTEAEARHALALGPESAIGTPHPGTSLQRWAHMLGFGGHFLTKGRLYSIRFRDLRDARITYRRTQDTGPEHKPIRTAEHADEETTLISATSLTPEPAGKPSATPSWPTPPPTKPESATKLGTRKLPTNATAPPAAAVPHRVQLPLIDT